MQCNDAYPSDYEETWHPVLAASVGNPVWANEIRELLADPDRLRNLVDADEAGRENPRSRGARSEHPGSPPPARTPPRAGSLSPEPAAGAVASCLAPRHCWSGGWSGSAGARERPGERR